MFYFLQIYFVSMEANFSFFIGGNGVPHKSDWPHGTGNVGGGLQFIKTPLEKEKKKNPLVSRPEMLVQSKFQDGAIFLTDSELPAKPAGNKIPFFVLLYIPLT